MLYLKKIKIYFNQKVNLENDNTFYYKVCMKINNKTF